VALRPGARDACLLPAELLLVAAGAATVVEAKLSSWQSFLALFFVLRAGLGSSLRLEIYTAFRPAQSQALMGRFGPGAGTHTDQVIIAGSLIIGLWLIADSIYLAVT
jgi:hypothetical protein